VGDDGQHRENGKMSTEGRGEMGGGSESLKYLCLYLSFSSPGIYANIRSVQVDVILLMVQYIGERQKQQWSHEAQSQGRSRFNSGNHCRKSQ